MSKIKLIIRGPSLSASGYGEHCRFLWRSLKEDPKLDLYIDNTSWGNLGYIPKESSEKREIYGLINKTKRYLSGGNKHFDVSAQVTIPNEFKKYADINIGVTAGIEVDRVSPSWIEHCEQMDKIITISEHSKNGLINTVVEMIHKDSGHKKEIKLSKPVSIVPYPVIKKPVEKMNIELDTSFNFLTMALLGDRKNIPNTISWFVEEFHDDEDVGLVVKTCLRGGSTIDKAHTSMVIRGVLSKFPDRKCKVYLLHGRLTEGEKTFLYSCDSIKAFVSLSHGEGFGLPLFEAAANGLPIVAPNWSGQCDFLNHPTRDKKNKLKTKALFTKVDYDLGPVQKSSIWEGVIEQDSRWCFPKKNSYKMKIREVYKNIGMKNSIAKKLQDIVLDKYDSKKMHDLFKKEVISTFENLYKENEDSQKEIDKMFSSLNKKE